MSSGVIYILTNPSFPQYVKIGYADNVESRLKQLNNSECIPFAFRIYATYEVQEPNKQTVPTPSWLRGRKKKDDREER